MKTKVCAKCKVDKNIDQFRVRGDKTGPTAYCKPCQQAFDREYWQKTKTKRKAQRKINDSNVRIRNVKEVRNYLKNHPCIDCGESDPIVLEFDHLGYKVHSISNLVRRRAAIKKLFTEIKKCVVRCANCHRRKTAKELNWYSDIDF